MTDKVRWMLGFYNRETNSRHQFEDGFPEFEFWQEDEESCIREGRRVIIELRERGDTREWIAYGHPDPFEVAAGHHTHGQWILSSSDLLSP